MTPHVAGNWPAHVYLECKYEASSSSFLCISHLFHWAEILHPDTNIQPGGTPESDQQGFLSDLISSIQGVNSTPAGKTKSEKNETYTLLENNLGVQLPLHISLSRPLALKTAQKDHFLSDLTSAIKTTSVRSFEVSPNTLTWHPNEDRTRWFLVLSLQRPEKDELRSLLEVCNNLAGEYGQPLLYQASSKGVVRDEKFHLSLAWSLVPQEGNVEIPSKSADSLKEMKIHFEEVKVRIGQDVTSIPLRKRRGGVFLDAS